MREIKFRAWNNHWKRMCIFNDIDPKIFWEDESNPHAFTLIADAFVLMQYTGLKDKNDKEIYEGDIIKTPYDFNAVSFVSPEDVMGVWIGKVIISAHHGAVVRRALVWYGAAMDDDFISYVHNPVIKKSTWSVIKSCEIIGNIHENPELLRAKS